MVAGRGFRFILITVTFVLLLSFMIHAAAPLITFIDPTLNHTQHYPENSFIVNVSSSVPNQDHYTHVDFDNHLVLWMRFDDTNSSGDPTDISTYANNGFLVGNALINTTGRFGDGAHFDGNADYVEIPDHPSLNFESRDFSFAGWFSQKDTEVTRQIIGKRVGGGQNYEIQVQSSGKIRVYLDNSANFESSTDVDDRLNEWIHFVFTRENDIAYLYIDGVLENQTSSTQNVSSSSNFFIGKDPVLSSEYANGAIDEIMVLNRSLSASEISSLYNATATRYQHNFTSLSQGNHTFTAYAVAGDGDKNQTSTRIVTLDFVNPSVSAPVPTASTNFNGNTVIEIAADVTDDLLVGTVLANITHPDSSSSIRTLVNAVGAKFNVSFTVPNTAGTYNITFIANDTAGNLNSSIMTNFTVTEVELPIPEWEEYAVLLILLVVVGGFFRIREER